MTSKLVALIKKAAEMRSENKGDSNDKERFKKKIDIK